MRIHLFDLFGSECLIAEYGASIAALLFLGISTDQKIELDFSGVESITSQFIAAMFQLLPRVNVEKNPDIVLLNVAKDMADEVSDTINRCVIRRKLLDMNETPLLARDGEWNREEINRLQVQAVALRDLS